MIEYSKIKGRLWRTKSHVRLREGVNQEKKSKDTLKKDCESKLTECGDR